MPSPRWIQLGLLLVAGCISVYINFPAAEVEDAADRIIEEVRPEIDEGAARPEEDAAGDEAARPFTGARSRLVALTAFPAEGPDDDEKIEIDLDDAVIARIRASLKERYPDLLPFYNKGALGERLDGLVEARLEEAELTLKEKRELEALIKAENRDRMNLYKRIVVINDEIKKTHTELVQGIFGRRWIAQCKKGWWIQVRDDEDGPDGKVRWVRKPKDPPEKKEKKEEKSGKRRGNGTA